MSGEPATFAVFDPATTETVAQVPDCGREEATAAVDAAHAAFASWSGAAPRERSDVLRRAYEIVLAESDRLSALICRENGKSRDDARAEVAYSAEFFRWYSEEAVRTEGAFGEAPAGNALTVVTHRPVGIAALVTPWNFPAAMAARKIAPALAAGCTVVLKPATETPLTALALAEILTDAGAPAGVVTVVPTSEPAPVVSTWLEDPRVRKLSFTGSTGVGRQLLRKAAERVLNSSMELGGNAPFVVMPDADIPEAVEGALVAKFRNGGQACTAANRFYVHGTVLDQFVDRLAKAMESLEVPPLIHERAVDRVRGLVDEAVADGALVRFNGPKPNVGWYHPATLLTGVRPDMRIAREEIFGPVVAVTSWDDERDLLRQVNDTEFGLAAYVYAGRLQDAIRVAAAMEAGMVGINRGGVSDPAAPFGGVKQSGLGREGAREGMREFQEAQYLSVAGV